MFRSRGGRDRRSGERPLTCPRFLCRPAWLAASLLPARPAAPRLLRARALQGHATPQRVPPTASRPDSLQDEGVGGQREAPPLRERRRLRSLQALRPGRGPGAPTVPPSRVCPPLTWHRQASGPALRSLPGRSPSLPHSQVWARLSVSAHSVPLGGGDRLAWPRLWPDPKLRPPSTSCLGRSSPGRILPHCPPYPWEAEVSSHRLAFGSISAGHQPCRLLKRPDVTLLERRRLWGCCWVGGSLRPPSPAALHRAESCSPHTLPPRDTELSPGCSLWAAAPACLVGWAQDSIRISSLASIPSLDKNLKVCSEQMPQAMLSHFSRVRLCVTP